MKCHQPRLCIVFAFLSSFWLRPEQSYGQPANGHAAYQNAVVAADHAAASEAGLEILQRGGNIVDAAVATSFALSVVRPGSCGLGGGGFMVIWNSERQEAIAIDYRERAPAAAHRDMFVNKSKEESEASRAGGLAVAIPGTVAGLCFIAETYGTLPLSDLLQPAIRLAREGVPVDQTDRHLQSSVLRDFRQHPPYAKRFATLKRLYLNDGEKWPEGSVFQSPQLRVLQLIAEQGRDGFYKGNVASSIVEVIQREGGVLTLDDLAGYQPTVRKPLRGSFQGHDIITMPPPSSGGVALIEMFNILERLMEKDPQLDRALKKHNDPEYVHLVTEAMKHAFADRAEFLGDADYASVPIERLISRDYARELSTRIDPQMTKPSTSYGRFLPARDAGTSHFSIMDRHGNAVACTETINTYFGSLVVDPQFGVVLNNEMDDFAAVPGQPNAFGLMQSQANSVEPGKRPLSSMTPTIVLKEGSARFVAGASGGPKIITATFQVLLNEILFDMPPGKAVRSSRFHHQWLPDVLNVEPDLFGDVQHDLSAKKHLVKKSSSLGVSQSASRSPDGLRGASDPRKGGRPAGY